MIRLLIASSTLIILAFAHQGLSQQPLMEPEMALYNLNEMEPRVREGFRGPSDLRRDHSDASSRNRGRDVHDSPQPPR